MTNRLPESDNTGEEKPKPEFMSKEYLEQLKDELARNSKPGDHAWVVEIDKPKNESNNTNSQE